MVNSFEMICQSIWDFSTVICLCCGQLHGQHPVLTPRPFGATLGNLLFSLPQLYTFTKDLALNVLLSTGSSFSTDTFSPDSLLAQDKQMDEQKQCQSSQTCYQC